MHNKHSSYGFYDTVAPIKLTEAQRIKVHTKGWGILSEYYLESIKINHRKDGILSVATLRIGDISGQTTCVVKGCAVSLLFGLSNEEWKEVENLCLPGQQLYYRYFKNGLNLNYNHEQKLFYNFCATNQYYEVLVARFIKCINVRKNHQESLLEVLELQKCDTHLLDLYTNHLWSKDMQPMS